MLARLNATGKGGSAKLASGGGRSKKAKKAILDCQGNFWLHLRLSCSDECLCVACFCKAPPITDDDPQGGQALGVFALAFFLEFLLQFFLGQTCQEREPAPYVAPIGPSWIRRLSMPRQPKWPS